MEPTTPIHAAAAILAGLAALHLGVALHDAVRDPLFLKPADKPLLSRMKKTKPVMAPQGRSYWLANIGAHLGHVVGMVLFVFLIELALSPLMAWLRPPLLAIAALYTLIAWRCWFTLPAGALAAATALLAWGWFG